jgi:phosphopantetheinyl transferase (holo-ACP synthase)
VSVTPGADAGWGDEKAIAAASIVAVAYPGGRDALECLTSRERQRMRRCEPANMAGRLAAKSAACDVLGLTRSAAVMQEIEILPESRCPDAAAGCRFEHPLRIVCTGRAEQARRSMHAAELAVSISHAGGTAVALVVRR